MNTTGSTKFVSCKNQDVKFLSCFPYHLLVGTLLIFLSASSIALNMIFLAAARYSQKRLLSDNLYYLLAVTDILTSLMVMPLYASQLFRIAIEQKLFCTLWIVGTGSAYIFGFWSAVTITTITVELYISVAHPYFYESSMSTKRVITSILVVWLLSFIAICVVRVSSERLWKLFKVFIALLTIPIVIAMFIMHYRTYAAIRNMGLRCKDQSLEFKLMIKTKKKLLKTVVYILVTFFCCFLPIGIISVHSLFTNFGNIFIDSYVYPVCETLVLSNAFFDPFVYYFRLKRIRRSIRRIICCTYKAKVQTDGNDETSNSQKMGHIERSSSRSKIVIPNKQKNF